MSTTERRPVPPTVRAVDADGSEFYLDADGLAWRADMSRAPELDGPAIIPNVYTCRKCHGRTKAAGAYAAEGFWCCSLCGSRWPEMPPSAAPLDRGEVLAVLAREWADCTRRVTHLGDRTERVRRVVSGNVIVRIARALNLSAEFESLIAGEVPRG